MPKDFVDPLGANSSDFEARGEYNPSSRDLQRSRQTRSGSGSGSNVDVNNNAPGGSSQRATGVPQTSQGSTRTGSGSGAPASFFRVSDEQMQQSESLYEQMRRRMSETDRPAYQQDIVIGTTQRNVPPPQNRGSNAGAIGSERRGSTGAIGSERRLGGGKGAIGSERRVGGIQGRGQFLDRAQLEALIQNQGQVRVHSGKRMGPQQRERLRSEQNKKQSEPDNSDKHVLLPQVTVLCQQLNKELNDVTILANLRNRIQRLQVEPGKTVAQKMIPKLDRLFRPYRSQVSLNTMDDKCDKIVKKFCFEPAALGTFPTFTSTGQFPDSLPSVHFNPVGNSYANELGPYDVCLEIEIPLPELKKTFLSIILPPTHVIKSHCCFLMQNTETDTSKKLYILPPGYYRRFTFNNQNIERDLQTASKSFTVPSSDERWHVYEAHNGFYFYRGRTFYLPQGHFITMEQPKLIRGLQILSAHIIHGSLDRIMNLDSPRIRQVKPHYEPLFVKYHEELEAIAVAQFHAERLGIFTSYFMKYSLLNLKPMLDDRFGGFANDVSGIIEVMEIAAYLLQVKHYRGYYGPAPPYTILKHEKVGPVDLNKRRLNYKDKRSKRKSMPIGDDGLPEPQAPFSRPKSKLAEEESKKEKDFDDDLFHLELD